MNHLKRLFIEALYLILKIFGEAFSDRKFSQFLLINQVFVQKFMRINYHVSWPVHPSSKIIDPQKIDRGTRCPGLSIGCYIDGRNGIVIGENTWIGLYVSIISMNHDYHDYNQYIIAPPIIIGKNVWLGSHCIILPNVKLGNHVVVAAGAVVTKSFEENNILLAGVPAKIVKRLSPYGKT